MSTKSASIPSRLLWRYPSYPALCQIFGECLTRLGDKPRGIISRKKVMVYLALTAWKLLLVTGGCLDMLFLWCISTMTLHKKKFTFKNANKSKKKIACSPFSEKKIRPSKRVLLIALIDEETFQVMFAGCKGRDSRRRVSVDPLYRNQSVRCQTLIRWNCEGLTHRIGRMWSQWLMSDWQQVSLRPQVFGKKCPLNSNEWKLRTLVGSGFQMKIYCWKRLENWLSVEGKNLIDLKTRCSQQ